MRETLAQSDELVDVLLTADLVIAAVPMYNFGVPAGFKAYIDNIVRVGRTFGFDRTRQGTPYWPLLAGMEKQLVMLSARGDHGYGVGGRIEAMNHVEPSIRTAFGYIGITRVHDVAVEYDEFGGQRLIDSLRDAEAAVDTLACRLASAKNPGRARPRGVPAVTG